MRDLRVKLKIGLLVPKESVSRWEYELVNELLNSEYASIEVVIISAKENTKNDRNQTGNILFSFHNKLDRRLFLGKSNYALKRNLGGLIRDVRKVELNSSEEKASKGQNQNAFSELRKLGLDIIIKLGYGRINEELCDLSYHGLWTYPMNGSDSESADTTGYYEVMENIPVTVSGLDVLLGIGQKPLGLARTIESTCSYSVSLNREKLFRRASLVIPRILKGLWQDGPSYLQRIEQRSKSQEYAVMTQLPPPSLPRSFGNLIKSGFILLRQILKKLFYSDPFTWVLLYQLGNGNDFENNSYRNFKKLKPPKDRFWADPFVMKKGDSYFIFVEEFIYKTNKGHISVLELDIKGRLLTTGRIIENPYHMSYPFVFESENTCYMIPETGGNRSIDLYRCVDFPWKWEFVKSVMKDINAVDTTLFRHEGKWWLLTLIDKIDSSLAVSPELYLFHSDDFLEEKWISHPMNPIVSDVRYARPAGKVFIRDGKIYRPSQDCSGRYGNSFDINEIVTLTPDYYEEKQITKVRPDWDTTLKGAHTYNNHEGFTIIDAYKLRRRFI